MLAHNVIVSKLEKRLRVKLGCVTASCEEFRINGTDGEIDLYGFNSTRRILFDIEVKGRDNPKNSTTAYHQLDKGEAYLRKLFEDFEPFKLVRMYSFSDSNKKRGYNAIKF